MVPVATLTKEPSMSSSSANGQHDAATSTGPQGQAGGSMYMDFARLRGAAEETAAVLATADASAGGPGMRAIAGQLGEFALALEALAGWLRAVASAEQAPGALARAALVHSAALSLRQAADAVAGGGIRPDDRDCGFSARALAAVRTCLLAAAGQLGEAHQARSAAPPDRVRRLPGSAGAQ
jgi:hypothetical protein